MSISFPKRIESAAPVLPQADRVDTRALGRVVSPTRHLVLPGLTAGKTMCRRPAAATAGFLFRLSLEACAALPGCTCIDERVCANVSPAPGIFRSDLRKLFVQRRSGENFPNITSEILEILLMIDDDFAYFQCSARRNPVHFQLSGMHPLLASSILKCILGMG